MAIQFEFYKNPQPEKEGEEPSYHPRVVNFQHVTTQKLAREIHMATTFGKAEEEARKLLENGNSFYRRQIQKQGSLSEDALVRVHDQAGNFYAIYEFRQRENRFVPVKMFR